MVGWARVDQQRRYRALSSGFWLILQLSFPIACLLGASGCASYRARAVFANRPEVPVLVREREVWFRDVWVGRAGGLERMATSMLEECR